MAKKEKKKLVTRIKDVADVITATGIIGAATIGCATWVFSQASASTNEKLDEIIEKVNVAELDAIRSQLLLLISNYPDNESEILKVAEYYFQGLDGDWYVTSIFTKWAEDRGIDPDSIINIKGGK
jgi:hypothetical protein